MKNQIALLVLCFLVSFCQNTNAQLYDVSRYADDSGLPSRIVRDVVQDHNGFLWVAGNNGLYKFDGQKFRPFYSALKDSTGLRDNKITAILEAADTKLWVGTPRGLHFLENDSIQYYDLKGEEIKDQNYIRNLAEDRNGNIWIGTYGGLFAIDKENKQSYFVSHPDIGGIPQKAIDGLVKNNNGLIWITVDNRLFVTQAENVFKFNEIDLTFDDDLTNQSFKLFRIIDFNDQFMVFESNIGLLKATLNKDKTIHVSFFYDENKNLIANHNIYRALVDHDQNIWIATWKNRFKKYQVLNGSLVELNVISTQGHFSNISGNAMSVYEDAQQNIWIPNTNGLYKLTHYKNNILNFPPSYLPDCIATGLSVYAIAEDKGGHLWVTTPVDLFRFKKSDLFKEKCPTDYIHIKKDNLQLVRYLLVDSKNRLWLSAEDGLFITQLDSKFNPGKFTRLTKDHGLPHNWCHDIYEEDENTFWVGNYFGLIKIKLDNNNLENSKIRAFVSESSDPKSLSNSYTIEIADDKDGNLWIGTFFGLSKLVSEEGSGSFSNFFSKTGDFNGLSNDAIKRIFRDSQDRLWIGTQTGLNLYNDKKDEFIQLGRNEGLPSEYILGLEEDSQGFLWIATTNGVIKANYDEQNERFINIEHYTKNEGLTDNITYRNALYIDNEDNVFIGSRNGLSILSEEKNIEVPKRFNLAITSIEVIKKGSSGFSAVSHENLEKALELTYLENSIRIDYAALDLTDIPNNRYRHKILPINKDWIQTDDNSEIIYYDLRPGNYEIILDGTNNSKQWSDRPIRVKLVIKPPFWKSNLAKLCYLILFLGILRISYLIRIRKHIRALEQQSILEKALVNEREQLRQENTADFHDELGSKVTKISLFLTLAERHFKENKDPTEWFLKIRDNIKDLSGGFRDLLWVIDPKKDSLNDTILRLKDYGEDLFNNGMKQFKVHGHLDDNSHLLLDPKTKKQVVLIFKEAMNNCAKYSECKHVELTIETHKDYTNIELKDDGIGFDVEIKSKGRGLKNIIERSEKIGANIQILSNTNGTTISLERIPHMSDSNNQKEA